MEIAIVLLALGSIFIFIGGGTCFDRNVEDRLLWLVALAVGLVLIVLGSSILYDEGKATGSIDKDNLKTVARYETRCVTRDNDGKYIVVLNHDNDYTCHRLDQQPPSVFKKTDDPKSPYQQYPR